MSSDFVSIQYDCMLFGLWVHSTHSHFMGKALKNDWRSGIPTFPCYHFVNIPDSLHPKIELTFFRVWCAFKRVDFHVVVSIWNLSGWWAWLQQVVNWLTAARSGAMAMMKQKLRYKMSLGKISMLDPLWQDLEDWSPVPRDHTQKTGPAVSRLRKKPMLLTMFCKCTLRTYVKCTCRCYPLENKHSYWTWP